MARVDCWRNLLNAAPKQGAWILRGQGLDQAAQRPFQLLTGVADGLLKAANLKPGVVEQIRSGLADYRESACAALPELGELLGSGTMSQPGPEEHVEARSVQALTAPPGCIGTYGKACVSAIG